MVESGTQDFYLFIDESGDHGLRNIDPGFPVFVLCGTLFSTEDYSDARNSMNSIKEEFWGDKEVIFHSVDIRKWRDAFQILINPKIRESFLNKLSKLMIGSKYTVFASGVRKEEFIGKYGKLHTDIYEVCLSFIIERLVFFIDDIPVARKRVTIIIEERGRKEDAKLKSNFNRLIQVGTRYVSPERLRYIGLSLHFRKKKQNINGLQFADLVAYPIARHILNPKSANPAYDIVKNHLYMKNGKEYGLKISP
ncbi:DUF3800 domain-containing protein [Pedobacter endophyticus]|uniref:DUF3800 domain-containing protein n=1 Tax=Pedobacter endophyticus TaxID=2789740 RepID=A0A7S9KY70_9SPHI|nr:DUF3800 domain-containing protein [Pedobacter endophyticus]QPH38999.1 DUF3800 domain-containing protein [Pedobacter endophyticus]